MWPLKKAKKQENDKNGGTVVRWETNAPADWPVIEGKPLPADAPTALMTIYMAARLTDSFKATRAKLELIHVGHDALLEEGVLSIPLIADVGGKKFAVFCYSSADEKSGAHFAGATRLLQSQSKLEPIYFAPGPLPETQAADPCRPFGHDLFHLRDEDKDPTPNGGCAMWWSTDEEHDILHSTVCEDIDASYKALDGIQSYVIASFYGALSGDEKATNRMMPPEEMVYQPVTGPEGRPLLLSICADKGLRFHFPMNSIPIRYRNRFWKHFRSYCEKWRKVVEEKRLPKDPDELRGALEWWQLSLEAIRKAQSDGQNKVKQFGTLA